MISRSGKHALGSLPGLVGTKAAAPALANAALLPSLIHAKLLAENNDAPILDFAAVSKSRRCKSENNCNQHKSLLHLTHESVFLELVVALASGERLADAR